VRVAAVLTLAGAVGAVIGGLVVWLVSSDMRLERALAYGFWFAAALMLLLMLVAGRRTVWRRTSVPVPEGWVFVTAAGALTVVGVVIDVVGS
jgi:hypothetical protein